MQIANKKKKVEFWESLKCTLESKEFSNFHSGIKMKQKGEYIYNIMEA